MNKVLYKENMTFEEFMQWLNYRRDEDGIARKIYVRGCAIYDIPYGIKEMFSIMMVQDSAFKNIHFIHRHK